MTPLLRFVALLLLAAVVVSGPASAEDCDY